MNVNPGDIVRVVAPARKSPDAALPAIKTYVESLGLVANISEDIYSTIDPFYSNTDEYRANDLISALVDDNVKIIWCVRGGTGSIRLIPYLENQLPATLNHKILIGYSDITVLHLYLQKKYGWQTIQGTMLETISAENYNRTSETVVALENLIFERIDKICVPATKYDGSTAVTRIESKVVGGNACLVEAGIGTLWEVNAEGKLLFLEDVGEDAYSIERSLDHMKQSGMFDRVDGVIIGDFTGADNFTLMDVVFQRFAESASFPVFNVTGMGHGPINYPLPFDTFTVINRIDTVTYELCVDNIESASYTSSGNGSSKLGFLNGLIVGIFIFFIY